MWDGGGRHRLNAGRNCATCRKHRKAASRCQGLKSYGKARKYAKVANLTTKGCVMSKPTIFTISAVWDEDASVWSGHCDDIPAAADAPTLDELLAKISAMALDVLPDNHPDADPASLYLQITALREAEPALS